MWTTVSDPARAKTGWAPLAGRRWCVRESAWPSPAALPADGLGYADHGEEEYSDVSDEESRQVKKRRQAEAAEADARAKKKRGGGYVEQATKITSLFLKPPTVLGPGSTADTKETPAAPAPSDDFLEGLLGDLDKPDPVPAAAPVGTARLLAPRAAAVGVASRGAYRGPRRALFEEMPPAQVEAEAGEFDHDGRPSSPLSDSERASGAAGAAEDAAGGKGEGVSAPLDPAAYRVGADRSKWKVTPKERVRQLAAPQSAGPLGESLDPADLVASLGDLDAVGVAESAEPGPAAASRPDAGDLPLNPDGTLHMFWLDAYEDPVHMSGVLYLFGKVCLSVPLSLPLPLSLSNQLCACPCAGSGEAKHVRVVLRGSHRAGAARVHPSACRG